MSSQTLDVLLQLAAVIESRALERGGDPAKSYTAALMARGSDAILKKVGEEATEVVMAAKDADHGGSRQRLIDETADLWFHSMIVLAFYGLGPQQVIQELERRAGSSGLDEKALRKSTAVEGGER